MLLLMLLSVIPVIVFKFIPIPATSLMFLRALEMKSEGDSMQLKYQWVSINNMSPNLFQASLAAEDDKFLTHNGFDFNAIKLAYESNQKTDKRTKGGSTISQQTAKNAFLWPHRDYLRKALEAWYTLLIELCWGKERIMEVYLNIVELGDGIFGVEAAANAYFNKHASELTKSEAAALIAVLPNPRIYRVLKPSYYTQRYKSAILYRMSHMPKVTFE